MVADRDPLAIAANQLSNTLPFAKNIRVRTVNSGHYMQLEVPDEVNKHLHQFILDVMKIPAAHTDFIAVSFNR